MKAYDIIYTVKIRQQTEYSELLCTDVTHIEAECEYDAIEILRDELTNTYNVRFADVVILWTHITDVSEYPDPDEEAWNEEPSPTNLTSMKEIQEKLLSSPMFLEPGVHCKPLTFITENASDIN